MEISIHDLQMFGREHLSSPFLFYSHSSTEESESPWKGSNLCG